MISIPCHKFMSVCYRICIRSAKPYNHNISIWLRTHIGFQWEHFSKCNHIILFIDCCIYSNWYSLRKKWLPFDLPSSRFYICTNHFHIHPLLWYEMCWYCHIADEFAISISNLIISIVNFHYNLNLSLDVCITLIRK